MAGQGDGLVSGLGSKLSVRSGKRVHLVLKWLLRPNLNLMPHSKIKSRKIPKVSEQLSEISAGLGADPTIGTTGGHRWRLRKRQNRTASPLHHRAIGAFWVIDVTKFADAVCVLHCFQKKTKKTSKACIALAGVSLPDARRDQPVWPPMLR